jgi:hypothetical protein
MKWVRKQAKSIVDDDMFVALIRVAQEDADTRKQLVTILSQPSFHRKSMLKTLIDRLKQKSAPKEFISIITYLLDDEVADKAREIINK